MIKKQFALKKMMKKFFAVFFFCLGCFFCNPVSALEDEGGQVILDLASESSTSEDAPEMSFSRFLEAGYNYFQDVKEYNDLLEGEAIEKDFSKDLRSKYPTYSDKTLQFLQKSIRKGVQGYRAYHLVKKKIADWVMMQELPVVVADDQYEMGKDEVYIETDKPIVVKDFKKIVAYSPNKRDLLAVKEKRAKEAGLTPPSTLLQKYKKALLQKDWKTLFGLDWRSYLRENYSLPETLKNTSDRLVQGKILSRWNGFDQSGVFGGVVVLKAQNKGFVLLGDYKDYKGLKVDFSESENVAETSVQFVWPQEVYLKTRETLLGYLSEVPIYFSGKVKDVGKKAVLKAKISAVVCFEKECHEERLPLDLSLLPKPKVHQTSFAAYVMRVGQNVPRISNEKHYDFKELVWEQAQKDKPGNLRLRLKTNNGIYFKILILGEEAKFFQRPSIRLEGKEISVRFEALNPSYNPTGKTISFWVMKNEATQFLKTMTVMPVSKIDTKGSAMTFGVVGLAFLGGLLLNLMPCVFPVLSLKLLAFTKFGGQNVTQVRKNFLFNSFGIFVSFICLAAGLSFLKLGGTTIGWGMQFQNIYFLVGMIWVVTLFLAHVFGFVSFGVPQFAGKFLTRAQSKESLFEFLSGVFLVLLSTPCMAPYLGTAFGIALAGSIADLWAAVLGVGLGLMLPYLLIAIFPKIATYAPHPGKWLDFVHLLMVVMLVVTLGWLVSVLSAQSSTKELWHWGGYIFFVLVVLFFRKAVFSEIEKLDDPAIIKILRRRAGVVFGLILAGVFVLSCYDAASAAKQRQEAVHQSKFFRIDFEEIRRTVEAGHKVLVKIGADWCLTCKYNDAFVFDTGSIKDAFEREQAALYEVDWTHYDAGVLSFMQRYGRQGLPFYVLFSQKFPEGFVLPELPRISDVEELLEM